MIKTTSTVTRSCQCAVRFFVHPNQEYYFKTGEEMKKLFTDLPEAIWNLAEIVDKVKYTICTGGFITKFDIPEEFCCRRYC
jgi:DNA polymerase III alpha subunit